MADPAALLEFAPALLSNLAIATGLALLAFAVQRVTQRPGIAHVLWLAVLLKLITPPVVALPWLPPPAPAATASTPAAGVGEGLLLPRALLPPTPPGSVDSADFAAAAPAAAAAMTDGTPAGPSPSRIWLTLALLGLWATGSAVMLAWSAIRVLRFRNLLHRSSARAPEDVQQLARSAARRLGLRHCPAVLVTTARLSPFVWWCGGRVRIVLPTGLREQLPPARLRDVLAHELAHVSRGDHLVRWLEWLCGVAFWWNPVFWWARHHLRQHEETGCDALVLHSMDTDPRRYGESLISVVEFLSTPAIRPPAVASAMWTGGQLEKRLHMIVSRRAMPAPRWLTATLLTAAVALLPLRLATSQDFNAVERRLGESVAAGEITLEHAQIMMDALRRSVAGEAHGPHSTAPAPEARATLRTGGTIRARSLPPGPDAVKEPAGVIRSRAPRAIGVRRPEPATLKRKMADLKAQLEAIRSMGDQGDKAGAEKLQLMLKELGAQLKAVTAPVIRQQTEEQVIEEIDEQVIEQIEEQVIEQIDEQVIQESTVRPRTGGGVVVGRARSGSGAVEAKGRARIEERIAEAKARLEEQTARQVEQQMRLQDTGVRVREIRGKLERHADLDQEAQQKLIRELSRAESAMHGARAKEVEIQRELERARAHMEKEQALRAALEAQWAAEAARRAAAGQQRR